MNARLAVMLGLAASTAAAQPADVAERSRNGTLGVPRATDGALIITGEALLRTGAASLGEALTGKFASAHVLMPAGAFGALPAVLLRAPFTLRDDNHPLVLLDDVPWSTALLEWEEDPRYRSVLGDLPLTSIDSLIILPSVTAAARYGQRAFAGAILIKTRAAAGGRFSWTLHQRAAAAVRAERVAVRRFSRAEALAAPPPEIYTPSPDDRAAAWDACNGFCDHQRRLFGGTRSARSTDAFASVRIAQTSVSAALTVKAIPLAQRNLINDSYSFHILAKQAVGRFQLSARVLRTVLEGVRYDERASPAYLPLLPSYLPIDTTLLPDAPPERRKQSQEMLAATFAGDLWSRGSHRVRLEASGARTRLAQDKRLVISPIVETIHGDVVDDWWKAELQYALGTSVALSLGSEELRKQTVSRWESQNGTAYGIQQRETPRFAWFSWVAAASVAQARLRTDASLRLDRRGMDPREAPMLAWQVNTNLLPRSGGSTTWRLGVGQVVAPPITERSLFGLVNVREERPGAPERRREVELGVTSSLHGGRGRLFAQVAHSVTAFAMTAAFTTDASPPDTSARLRTFVLEGGGEWRVLQSSALTWTASISGAHARTRMIASGLDATARTTALGLARRTRAKGQSITGFLAPTGDSGELVGDGWPTLAIVQQNAIGLGAWTITTSTDALIGVRFPQVELAVLDYRASSPDAEARATRLQRAAAGEPAYTHSASYLRLREVSVTRDLTWNSRLTVQLQCAVRNLATMSPHVGLDPAARPLLSPSHQDFSPFAQEPALRSLWLGISLRPPK